MNKEEEEEENTVVKFPSLVFLSARTVLHINLNCMYNLERAVIDTWECECDRQLWSLCNLCLMYEKHKPHFPYFKKRYKIKELINQHMSLIDDFKKNSYLNISDCDYIEKYHDYREDTFSIWSLYDHLFKTSILKNDSFYL